jgi:hypothetical protein
VDTTLQIPLGLLASAGLKVMPPVVEFGCPVQRAKNEGEAWWHVPVKIYPFIFKFIGPATVANCQAFLDLYRGDTVENSIRLAWGDMMLESPREFEMLRKGHVSLIPIAWRSENDSDKNGYFTDTRFIAHNREKSYPIKNDRDKYRFRLRVKSGSFVRTRVWTHSLIQ